MGDKWGVVISTPGPILVFPGGRGAGWGSYASKPGLKFVTVPFFHGKSISRAIFRAVNQYKREIGACTTLHTP